MLKIQSKVFPGEIHVSNITHFFVSSHLGALAKLAQNQPLPFEARRTGD
jgi:hypothetical protein